MLPSGRLWHVRGRAKRTSLQSFCRLLLSASERCPCFRPVCFSSATTLSLSSVPLRHSSVPKKFLSFSQGREGIQVLDVNIVLVS